MVSKVSGLSSPSIRKDKTHVVIKNGHKYQIIKHGGCWRLLKGIKGLFLILVFPFCCCSQGKKLWNQAITGQELKLIIKKVKVQSENIKHKSHVSENPTMSGHQSKIKTPSTSQSEAISSSAIKPFTPYTTKGLIDLIDLDMPRYRSEYNYIIVMYSADKISKINEMLESFEDLHSEFNKQNVEVLSNKYFKIHRLNEYVVKVELKAYVTSGLNSYLYDDNGFEFEIRPYGLVAFLRGHLLAKKHPEIYGFEETVPPASFGRIDKNTGVYLISHIPQQIDKDTVMNISPNNEPEMTIFRGEQVGGVLTKEKYILDENGLRKA